jgi:hypothetical protein
MPEHEPGMMIALGGPHEEPDGDEYEGDDGDDGPLPEHDYKHDAMDILDALHVKGADANEFAHALEHFVKKCIGR